MAEKSIELDSVEIAAAVFGNCDRNIRMLEKEFSVTAVCRGTMLRISGEPANVAAAARAVEGMLLLIENHTPLEDQTVRYCLSLAHDGEEKRVRELTEDFVTVTVKGRPIRPKTLGQKEYLNSIRNNAITFGVGPAGTGKTYLAVAMAVKAFKAKDVSRIVLTRPAVEAGQLVLCDRFVDSSVAYQGGGRELGVRKIQEINAPAVEGTMPDATVYLDIDHRTAFRRRSAATALDRLEMQEEAFHARVEAAYRQMIQEDAGRFLIVDAAETPQQVADAVWAKVYARLTEAEA